MKRLQARFVLGMILLQATVMAVLTQSLIYPAILAALTLLGFSSELRIVIPRERRLFASLLLAIPFALQWAFLPYEGTELRTFILFSLLYSSGLYTLTLQVAYLWIRSPEERWASSLPLLGVWTLMASGDIQVTLLESWFYQAAVLSFLLLTVGYFGAERTRLKPLHVVSHSRRQWLTGATLTVSLSLSLLGSWWLQRSFTEIERLYVKWMMPNSGASGFGFSRNPQLQHHNASADQLTNSVELRVEAAGEPGYLRGGAYDKFVDSRWSTSSRPIPMVASEIASETWANSNFLTRFDLSSQLSPSGSPAESWEVWPSASLSDALFVPLGAREIQIPVKEVRRDEHEILFPDDLPVETSYLIIPGRSSVVQPLTGDYRKRCLELPAQVDSRIEKIAEKVFAGANDSQEKIARVVSWFRSNFRYELGLKIPSGQDPVTFFLTVRPAAHCEFFASGAALLLRIGGVPCRYVTGYVVSEKHYLGSYWIARKSDAHAWLEAYLPGKGWVTVEATPEAGVPSHKKSWEFSQLWDDVVFRFNIFRAQLALGNWQGMLGAAKALWRLFLSTPVGWLMSLGLLVWGGVLWRRYRPRALPKAQFDPLSQEYHKLLARLEQGLEKRGLSRAPQETLHQFADRILNHGEDLPEWREVADWYLAYAAARYQLPPQAGDEPLEVLKARAIKILAEISVPLEKRPSTASKH